MAFLKFIHGLRRLTTLDSGQNLVEYGFVLALIAFGCTAGMNSLDAGINTAFSHVATTLTSYT